MPVDIDAYRQEVRSFIADHAPPDDTAREYGFRVTPTKSVAIRTWLSVAVRRRLPRRRLARRVGRHGRPPTDPRPGAHGGADPRRRVPAARPGDARRAHDHRVRHRRAATGRLLPKIRSGEHIWCQLFSEPDAGSDLAALRTRAEPDGDGFVVTGQKIWSTDAQWADMGTLLARTDPTVDRHAGITAFVIPMDLPGIEVRPIREMTGHAEFCEVFLDEVRVGPEHVLGEVNGGWKVITSGLGIRAGIRRRQRRPARTPLPRSRGAGVGGTAPRRHQGDRARGRPGTARRRASAGRGGQADRARHRRADPGRRRAPERRPRRQAGVHRDERGALRVGSRS